MSKIEELQQQINGLTALLAQAGITLPQQRSEHRPDYIPHGSAQHAVFLGLVEVEDEAEAKAEGYTVYASKQTGKAYRLDDEIGAVSHYPGTDPDKAVLLVLRQKVGSLESGVPQAPAGAPPMFTGGEEVFYA